MSTSTTSSRIELPAHESDLLGRVQAPGTASHPPVTADDTCGMSPLALKILSLTLLGVGLLLASMAVYVWTGSLQWLKLQ